VLGRNRGAFDQRAINRAATPSREARRRRRGRRARKILSISSRKTMAAILDRMGSILHQLIVSRELADSSSPQKLVDPHPQPAGFGPSTHLPKISPIEIAPIWRRHAGNFQTSACRRGLRLDLDFLVVELAGRSFCGTNRGWHRWGWRRPGRRATRSSAASWARACTSLRCARAFGQSRPRPDRGQSVRLAARNRLR